MDNLNIYTWVNKDTDLTRERQTRNIHIPQATESQMKHHGNLCLCVCYYIVLENRTYNMCTLKNIHTIFQSFSINTSLNYE